MTSESPPDQQIRNFLESASQIDFDDTYVRSRELGNQLDFSACESAFLDFKRLAVQFSQAEWARLPHSTQEETADILWQIRGVLRDIRNYSATEGPRRRDGLVNTFIEKLDSFKRIALAFGAYLLLESGSTERQLRSTLQEAEQQLESVRERQREAEQRLELVRERQQEAELELESVRER